MTHTALIRIAPLVTPNVLRNPARVRAGRVLYQRGALELQPGAPLLVDHDHEREVGQVHALAELPDVDGLWLAAHCRVTCPPEWLARGACASFQFAPLSDQDLGGWRRALRGLVTEVSVLSPGVEPAEPGARVVLVRRAQDRAARISRRPAQRLRREHTGEVLAVR